MSITIKEISTEWVETETSQIGLKDGIMITRAKNNVFVSLENREENFRVIQQLCQGVCRPILMDVSQRQQSISIPYLRYISKNAHQYFTGAAVLVGSPTSKFIARFFSKLFMSNIQIPVKFTTSEKEGIQWLQQFKNK